MLYHMATLGFPVTTEPDFRHYVYQASEFGQRIESTNGSYTYWAPGNGIELWVQTNRHKRLIGMNPHFSGRTRLRANLTARLPRYEHSILDGAFYAWSSPLTDRSRYENLPFVFDLPDYDLYDRLELPSTIYVQLTAFAQYLRGFKTEDAYRAAQTAGELPALETFVPTGLFTRAGRVQTPAQAEATLSGHILATSKVLNPVTDQRFYWAKVHTPIGEIDVVADSQIVQGQIVMGGIVQGTFWLSGRLL